MTPSNVDFSFSTDMVYDQNTEGFTARVTCGLYILLQSVCIVLDNKQGGGGVGSTLHQRDLCPKAARTLSGAEPRTSSSSTYIPLHPLRRISIPRA